MKKEYVVIEEEQVVDLLTIPLAISTIERCFKEKAEGKFRALPKVNIEGENGSLRITPGESLYEFNAIGFRLYDVIRNDYSNQPQLITVYNNTTGQLKGIIISQMLGAYRTAAINAVMQKFFHPKPIESLGVVGTGFQARIHTLMFDFLLKPQKIKIYGRTPENVEQFVKELSNKVAKDVEIEICNQIEDLQDVDSLLLATRSTQNLLDPKIFSMPMTITTIGPKGRKQSEVSNEFAKSCDLIVTDSIEQVLKYGEHFFVHNLSSIQDFSLTLKNGQSLNQSKRKILLCSVGMGGTEVALANELINLVAS